MFAEMLYVFEDKDKFKKDATQLQKRDAENSFLLLRSTLKDLLNKSVPKLITYIGSLTNLPIQAKEVYIVRDNLSGVKWESSIHELKMKHLTKKLSGELTEGIYKEFVKAAYFEKEADLQGIVQLLKEANKFRDYVDVKDKIHKFSSEFTKQAAKKDKDFMINILPRFRQMWKKKSIKSTPSNFFDKQIEKRKEKAKLEYRDWLKRFVKELAVFKNKYPWLEINQLVDIFNRIQI